MSYKFFFFFFFNIIQNYCKQYELTKNNSKILL